jgi:hypothetical protein
MSSSDTSVDGGLTKPGPDFPQKLHVGGMIRLARWGRKKDSKETSTPCRFGTCASLASGCKVPPARAMSIQRATHSAQIVTVGPPINLTSIAHLPQKLQAVTKLVAVLTGLPFGSYHILLALPWRCAPLAPRERSRRTRVLPQLRRHLVIFGHGNRSLLTKSIGPQRRGLQRAYRCTMS